MSTILGVDHICASCASIEAVENAFNRLTFRPLFRETFLSVPEEKRRFLRQSTDDHNAVFLKPSSGVSVEMIDHHGSLNDYQAPYQVLLEHADVQNAGGEDIGPVGRAIEAALGNRILKGRLPDFKLAFFQTDGPGQPNFGVGLVALACRDFSRAIWFWQDGVGFCPVASSAQGADRWCLLQFTAPMPAWCLKLLLVETVEVDPKPFFMDDSGWTCLSFLVTDMEAALQGLKACGSMEVGRPYATRVGAKNMRLCFLRGPELELVELIQIERE